MDTPQDNPEGYKDVLALTGNYYKDAISESRELICTMQFNFFISKYRMRENVRVISIGYRHGFGGAKVHSRNEANNFWLEKFFWKII